MSPSLFSRLARHHQITESECPTSSTQCVLLFWLGQVFMVRFAMDRRQAEGKEVWNKVISIGQKKGII